MACHYIHQLKPNKRQVKKRVSAGTLDVNDCLMHMMVPTLPFGGVGHSGMGLSFIFKI